jgi:hypothetical protein
MAATALAPDYQRILAVLESEAGREGMRCRQLAVALGLEAIPAKVEGLRWVRATWRSWSRPWSATTTNNSGMDTHTPGAVRHRSGVPPPPARGRPGYRWRLGCARRGLIGCAVITGPGPAAGSF